MNKSSQPANYNNLNRRQSENAVKKGSKDRNISSQKSTKPLMSNSNNALNNQANCSSLNNYNGGNTTQNITNCQPTNYSNQNVAEQTLPPFRKVRANSCTGVMKTNNQAKKHSQNLNETSQSQNTSQRTSATLELYSFVKSNIDKDIIQGQSQPDFNESELLLNIKQLLEINFIQSKAAEKELKEKHEQECDSYDKNLQRLEAQIRDHIRIQQELKLYLESSQIKCQEQEEQIKTQDKVNSQQTDFLEKVCEQMQQQLEIKDASIEDMKKQIATLQQEMNVLKENTVQKQTPNIPKNRIQQDFQYYSKQMSNLSNHRSQTENSSQRKIKQATPTHLQNMQTETLNQIQTDQSLAEDKENNMIQGNQIQISVYKSQLKQSMRDDVSPEKKIQTIIQQQKLQSSQQKQKSQQHINIASANEKKQVTKVVNSLLEKQEKGVFVKMGSFQEQKDKRKESDNYSSVQTQATITDRQFQTIQPQTCIVTNANTQQIKSNGNIPSCAEPKFYATGDQKTCPSLPETTSFQEKMIQASKKIKEYIKQQSARDKNNTVNKQQLINKLKYFSMKNSRAPSITNQNNLIQYFYEKFEDKLEKNPSERSNIKQKMKTLQQISDRRYSTINHKTEESEGERRNVEQKRSQRHNRSNSFNIGSQLLQQSSCSNQMEQKQTDGKFAKKQKNYIPLHSTLSSHNNISNSGIASNNYNLNQIGNLNTNSSNLSNFMINNSFTNWNKRRESVFNQSGNNNISFQLDGAQKIIMNNNYIDESSDSFENFIKDNFILTNNSTENLKTLEL